MKKYVFLILLSLFVVGSVTFLYKMWKKPAVYTPLTQNIWQEIEKTNNSATVVPEKETATVAKVVEPGNYALVENPKHIYQTFNNCGPATLSMMFSWYGVNVSQGELGNKMRPHQISSGDNDDKTIFTYEFVDWAQEYGLEAVGRVNGDIELLKKFTANGIPVVVKTWLHADEDIGHFRIVRGFDEEKKVIIQDDSYEGPNINIPYNDFLALWQPFNYDYIIVFTPELRDTVEAIIGEELDEEVAWSNSLERAEKEKKLDSKNPYPAFNISTSSYNLGDYERSVSEFEEVEKSLPKRMLWYQIEPLLAYKELGNYDRVFEITDNILENGNRAYSELYLLRGNIYLDQKMVEKANEEFDLAVKYNINFKDIVDNIQ